MLALATCSSLSLRTPAVRAALCGRAQRAGGIGNDYAYALALSGSSVYVAGNIGNAPAYFGNIVLPTTHGGNDLFVARLTDKGSTTSFKWVQQAGGSQGDNAYGLAVTRNGTLYVGGYVSQPASFGASFR